MSEPSGSIFGPLDAETDDLTQFTGTLIGSGNALSASGDYKLHGNYSFKATFGGSTGYVAGYKTTAAQTDMYIRIYIRFHTLALADNAYINLYSLRDSLYGNPVCQLRIFGTGTAGQYGYQFYTYDNSGFDLRLTNHRDDNIFQDDIDYFIEIHWKQGNGNGIEQLWISGVSQGSRTNVTNTSYSIAVSYIGSDDAGNVPSAGTVYFDDCKADSSYIGAYSLGGPNQVQQHLWWRDD